MLSKRYMVMFDRSRAVKNVQFFRTGLNVEPVVLVYWYEKKAQCYVVAEKGFKAWDITEPHATPHGVNPGPADMHFTELSAEAFLKAVEEHPEDWYHEPPKKSFGKRVYEPFDEKRNRAGERYHDGIHHPKKEP